jgi:hypothetical protein
MVVIQRPSLPEARVFIVWRERFSVEGVVDTLTKDKPLMLGAAVELKAWSSLHPNLPLVEGVDFKIKNGPDFIEGPEFTLKQFAYGEERQAPTFTRCANLPRQKGAFTVRYRFF